MEMEIYHKMHSKHLILNQMVNVLGNNNIILKICYLYYHFYAGCVCVYSNSESFEYIRDSLEKTLLSNLEKDDRLPFQGLPIILLYINESGIGQKDLTLQEEGQSLANRYIVILKLIEIINK